ncbi:DUF6300 family protein [Streptomyces vietnamensis]|uniref:DUF6300 family protein n=1 Tax=Streptomyces vietnamensis TaxID=362257 RepID=UPI000B2C9F36|nr:DUF6300 family protein [Streptomyces vietnamensis]
MSEEEIVLSLNDPPACAQCGGLTLLKAEFPHTWKNATEQDVTGVRAVALCPECDRGEPSADALLALFTVDGQLSEQNLTVFTDLMAAWLDVVRHKSVDMERLDAEHKAWLRGELDNDEADGLDGDAVR